MNASTADALRRCRPTRTPTPNATGSVHARRRAPARDHRGDGGIRVQPLPGPAAAACHIARLASRPPPTAAAHGRPRRAAAGRRQRPSRETLARRGTTAGPSSARERLRRAARPSSARMSAADDHAPDRRRRFEAIGVRVARRSETGCRTDAAATAGRASCAMSVPMVGDRADRRERARSARVKAMPCCVEHLLHAEAVRTDDPVVRRSSSADGCCRCDSRTAPHSAGVAGLTTSTGFGAFDDRDHEPQRRRRPGSRRSRSTVPRGSAVRELDAAVGPPPAARLQALLPAERDRVARDSAARRTPASASGRR